MASCVKLAFFLCIFTTIVNAKKKGNDGKSSSLGSVGDILQDSQQLNQIIGQLNAFIEENEGENVENNQEEEKEDLDSLDEEDAEELEISENYSDDFGLDFTFDEDSFDLDEEENLDELDEEILDEETSDDSFGNQAELDFGENFDSEEDEIASGESIKNDAWDKATGIGKEKEGEWLIEQFKNYIDDVVVEKNDKTDSNPSHIYPKPDRNIKILDICNLDSKNIEMNGQKLIINSPDPKYVHADPEQSLMCKSVLNFSKFTAVKVEIVEFDLDPEGKGTSMCNVSSLRFFEGQPDSHRAQPITKKLCGNLKQIPRKTFFSHDDFLIISYTSNSHSDIEKFKISITPLTREQIPANEYCGSLDDPYEITPQILELASPGFNGKNSYMMNSDCYYKILLSEEFDLEATVDTFDVEQSHMCNFDYLAIYDALSGNLTSKLCGTYPENRVLFTSEGKDLLLHFHSDQSGSNKGFKLNLKFRTSQGLAESLDGDDGDSMTRKKKSVYQRACKSSKGATFKKKSRGYIKSPRYPKLYRNNLNCLYKLRKKSEGVWRITFHKLHVEHAYNCKYDHVLIYDAADKAKKYANGVKLCGSKRERPIWSKSKSVNIEFVTDKSGAYPGFKLEYRFYKKKDSKDSEFKIVPEGRKPIDICRRETTLNENRGFVEQGNPDNEEGQYFDNANCKLRVKSRNGKKLVIRFKSVSLYDETKTCEQDWVSLTDANGEMIKLCKFDVPKFYFITESDYFDVKFVSNAEMNSKGFLLEFKASDSCPRNYAQCGSRCVHKTHICDGEFDCANGRDEAHCNEDKSPCGKPKVSARNVRIVGGEPAKKNSWPWQAGLIRSGQVVCGGSLIAPDWVLTAAHCVDGSMQPKMWKIALGDHKINKGEEKGETVRNVEKIFMYPDYNPNTINGDAALMKLSKPVKYSKYILPICLPKTDVQIPKPGTVCYVTGWGDTEETGSRMTLRQVDLKIISTDVCTSEDVYGNWVSPNMFCAGYSEGGKDACQGDSGGPLVCHDKIKDKWIQHGIVSWGLGCADPNKPGVYTRINKMKEWIDSVVDE